MQNDKTYFEIGKLISTKSDIDEAVGELDRLESALYSTIPGSFEAELTKIRKLDAGFLRQSLETAPDKAVFLKGLKDWFATLVRFSLTLAFLPSEAFSAKLAEWVKLNLGLGYYLSIELDKKILGGATVSVGGKFLDLTISKKLSEDYGI